MLSAALAAVASVKATAPASTDIRECLCRVFGSREFVLYPTSGCPAHAFQGHCVDNVIEIIIIFPQYHHLWTLGRPMSIGGGIGERGYGER